MNGSNLINSPEPSEHRFSLRIGEDTKLPKFSTKDICVLQKLVGDGYIARVLAGGLEMCSKVGDGMRADSVVRIEGTYHPLGD